jgi:signal transduction histidine kinase
MDKVILFLKKQPRPWLYAEAFGLFVMTGFIDYVTGNEISIYPFYSIPILLILWFGDLRIAILIAVTSAAAWWAVDIVGGHVYSSEWWRAWDAIIRLIFFVLVLFAGWSVKRHREDTRARIELLERSQRLENEIISISEQERQRIGRDLHDGVCQYLAAIRLTASMLKKELEVREAGDAARVGEIVSHLRVAASQVRQLARGLSPVDSDEGGLESALKDLAGSTAKMTGVSCRLVCSGAVPKLPNSTAIHLFRIAQEALSNAVKHGVPKTVVIALEANETGCSLRVTDDGVGLLSPAKHWQGMGLGTMRYRARIIGGSFDILPNSPSGTVVRCTVAVNNESK